MIISVTKNVPLWLINYANHPHFKASKDLFNDIFHASHVFNILFFPFALAEQSALQKQHCVSSNKIILYIEKQLFIYNTF